MIMDSFVLSDMNIDVIRDQNITEAHEIKKSNKKGCCNSKKSK